MFRAKWYKAVHEKKYKPAAKDEGERNTGLDMTGKGVGRSASRRVGVGVLRTGTVR